MNMPRNLLSDLLGRISQVEEMPNISLIKASNGWMCSIREMGSPQIPPIQTLGSDAAQAQIKALQTYFSRKEIDNLI